MIDFEKAHESLRIDDEHRRMRPAAAVGIKDAVAIDHIVVFVFEQLKIELVCEAFAPHCAEFFLIHGGYRRWDKRKGDKSNFEVRPLKPRYGRSERNRLEPISKLTKLIIALL